MTPEFSAIVSIGVSILVSVFAFGFAGLRELRQTTREIVEMRVELTGSMGALESRMAGEMGKTKVEIADTKTELKVEAADAKNEVGALRDRVEEIAQSSELVER